MRRLILLRHATAEGSAPGGDIDRNLTASGREDARRMGEALAAMGVRPDLALVSPAARARQTWDAVHDAFGDVEVELDPTLYSAGLSGLRQAVEAAGTRCETLIVVGHNPGLHQLAVDLLLEGSASPVGLDGLGGGLPPGAAVLFAVDAAGRARFEAVRRPDELDGAGA